MSGLEELWGEMEVFDGGGGSSVCEGGITASAALLARPVCRV